MKFNNREHMVTHQKTHEIDCSMCERSFQSNYKLQKHMRTVHDEMICHSQCGGGRCIIVETESQQVGITCNFCGEVFLSKNSLSTHKTDVHRTYKPCRDMANCVYQSGCYFSHVPITLGKVKCYQCGEEFNTKNVMMIHRKIHGGVKDCLDLIRNQCSRGDHCWWNHTLTEQVFQQVKENLPPPIQIRQQPMNIQMTQNQMIVNMLTVMDLVLNKIKEMLNMN